MLKIGQFSSKYNNFLQTFTIIAKKISIKFVNFVEYLKILNISYEIREFFEWLEKFENVVSNL